MSHQSTVFGLCVRLCASLILACATGVTSAAAVTDFTALDAYLQSELQRAGIPGGALVVVSGAKIVHIKGYGISSPEGRRPAADTVFQIGSNSKSFTALAIMQLVEAGKLQLDVPVQRYLPWFRVADQQASTQITLRHLLNQTSGFPHREGQLDFADTYAGADALERRVRRLADARLTSVPGQQWAYSNINSVVLGCVIEAISGVSYATYMNEHVFRPLGMGHTSATSQSPATADVATGYRFWFGKALPADGLPYPQTLVPAGYITSTARDMGAYLIAQLDQGQQVLSTSGLAQLHSTGANTGRRYGYAMGWATDSAAPGMLTHEGQTPAYTSAMGINLQKGWGFALLLNASDALTGPVVLQLGPQLTNFLNGVPLVSLKRTATWSPALIALVALLAIQCIIGIWMARNAPLLRSAGKPRWAWRASWPLAVGLLFAAALTLWIPAAYGINLRGMLLFTPDATWLLISNGVLAVCLGCMQTLKLNTRSSSD
ncbi:MAG: serine hydrolase domain-containing protein [Duganella sp.]